VQTFLKLSHITKLKPFLILSILLLTLVLLFYCKQPSNPSSNKNKPNAKVPFFDPIALGAMDQTSNISIEARFSECGEWGGHKEKLIVFADTSMNIHVRYLVYPYNCDSLKFYYGNENLNPVVDTTMTVGDIEKRSLSEYLQRITQAKIAERYPGHAGNVFSVLKSDSTFFIRVYDNKESNVNDYKKLIGELLN
jgi:hypothetical protein